MTPSVTLVEIYLQRTTLYTGRPQAWVGGGELRVRTSEFRVNATAVQTLTVCVLCPGQTVVPVETAALDLVQVERRRQVVLCGDTTLGPQGVWNCIRRETQGL